VKEQRPEVTPAETIKKSRLPEKTRELVQRAFADGVGERIDERKKSALLKERERWERNKWLLVRYVVDDQLAFEELKQYAGVTTREGARKLYKEALTIVWEASPPEIKLQFPKEEVIGGKRPGNKVGNRLSFETRAKISAAKMGHEVTQETKAKIATSNRKKNALKKQNPKCTNRNVNE
jgi:hypothetical protein